METPVKAVDYLKKCKNEIRVNFFNTIFCNTIIYSDVGQAFGSVTVLADKEIRLTSYKLCFISLKSNKIVKT